MRVNFKDDRGAASAFVVVLLAVFLGLVALVVDVTAAWQERRELVTTTDAAALAAAQDFVEQTNGCAATAADYVARNNTNATMTGCNHVSATSSAPGRVTVDAQAQVDFIFAPVLGFSDTTTSSSTTVNYDLASIITGGLRPFGLCGGVLETLSPTVVPGNGEIYRIVYGKDSQPDACGDENVGGNWGVLDFDGGSNPQGDIRDWTENGYDGPVAIGDIIDGNPGAYSSSLNDELDFLLTVDVFTLPVFDLATGNGSNGDFRISEFASVKLHGYKTNGNQADRYLDIEFLNAVVQGDGGGPRDGLGAFVIGICAVDDVAPAIPCQ